MEKNSNFGQLLITAPVALPLLTHIAELENNKRKVKIDFCEKKFGAKRKDVIATFQFLASEQVGVYYRKGIRRGEGHFVFNKAIESKDYASDLVIPFL